LEDLIMSTTTLNGNMNNVKPTQRKQLSEQLDRLDNVIDGLVTGLPEAVTDAVRDGARAAIKDALIEIITNPELRALLVPVAPAMPIPTPMPAAPTAPPPEPKRPSLWSRIKSKARAAKAAIVGAVVSAKDAVVGRCRAVRDAIVAIGVAGGEPAPVQKILVTAMAVGVVVTTACLVVPDTVAAVVSGVSAAATAVCVQVGGWLRRVACRVGLLA
jgi:hypothetical protein